MGKFERTHDQGRMLGRKTLLLGIRPEWNRKDSL